MAGILLEQTSVRSDNVTRRDTFLRGCSTQPHRRTTTIATADDARRPKIEPRPKGVGSGAEDTGVGKQIETRRIHKCAVWSSAVIGR